MAHHALTLLTPSAQASLKLHENKYQWKNSAERQIENDGLTVVHLIMQRLRPNALVDVFKEMQKIKALKLKDYKNVVPDFLYAMETAKQEIDRKNATAYPESQYLKDTFDALEKAPSEIFRQEMTRLKTRWITGKEILDPSKLISEATSLFINLESDNKWGKDHCPTDQIVALTTQVASLTKELKEVRSNKGSTRPSDKNSGTTKSDAKSGVIEKWRLKKV